MLALSRSMISQSETVAAVAYTAPRKPCLYSSGSRPAWSMCACVSKTKSILDGGIGSGSFSNRSLPCSMP